MKHLLLTTIAAVLLVGCGQSASDISIHDAAKAGDIEAVRQHLAAGAEVDAKDDNKLGMYPLHIAALGGHKEIVELLIAKGADVNAKEIYSYTPIHNAVINNRKAIVELLIAKGANVNSTDEDGRTPLDLAVNNSEIADLLRKHGGKTAEELK